MKRTFSAVKKERVKVIRSVFEGMILFLILIVIIRAFLPSGAYIPIDEEARVQVEEGFIALSYFGVDRTGDETLISTGQLDEHLKALKASGYVTITQQDVLDYYNEGTPLPSKALFLIFEDGRRDTAIFAQKIMEDYNMKGTILTYGQNLELQDPKFLSEEDLEELVDSSFWELGTNGYRLAYINVFDRYDHFLGELNTYEFQQVASYLDRNYNHYLMDYIRDEAGIPVENKEEMQARIEEDYKAIEEIYTTGLGKVPNLYILMHSNTGQFGTHAAVSQENEQWIQELFEMNFNREGYSKNTLDASIYDLTRVQPQAYWSTNHLLMRIWDDTGQQVAFVSGDEERKSDWEMIYGESEFEKEAIILTSLPKDYGLMKLKDSESYKDLILSVELEGNKVGSQTIYLRADTALERYLAVQVKDNYLYLLEKEEGKEKVLFSYDLDELDNMPVQTIAENEIEAEIKALEMALRYAKTVQEANEIREALEEKQKEQDAIAGLEAENYEPPLSLSEAGHRAVELKIKEQTLSLSVDEEVLIDQLIIKNSESGAIYLSAGYSDGGYSQRNLSDDVYDGIFNNLVVYSVEDDQSLIPLYDNRLQGMDKTKDAISEKWNSLINWFVKYL